MFGSLDTSTSALVANRIRMETVAANLANAHTITNEAGENIPFRRRIAVLQAGDPASGRDQGVHVREIELDPAPFMKEFKPDHPLADADGYIKKPNINSIMEQINAMEISRAYEANLQAAEATKSMMQSALRLLG
jgi:flagellar basal-body rod protein FlgC